MLLTNGCPLLRRKSPPQTVIKFAYANLPPVWRAAQLWLLGDTIPTKPIDRLLFAQGGLCCFCERQLSPAEGKE